MWRLKMLRHFFSVHSEKQFTIWAYLKTIQGLQSYYISKQNVDLFICQITSQLYFDELSIYLSTDYFGTCLIIFDNNMNTIGDHRKVRKPRGGQNLGHFYSIHVIVEYNLSGSEIICRQIYLNILKQNFLLRVQYFYFFVLRQ